MVVTPNASSAITEDVAGAIEKLKRESHFGEITSVVDKAKRLL